MHLAIDATNRNELENASLWSTARPQARRTQAEEAAILWAPPLGTGTSICWLQIEVPVPGKYSLF